MSPQKETIKVTKDAMPISCPPKGSESLSLHPRVYIKMKVHEGDGQTGKCPYCGNQFEMVG